MFEKEAEENKPIYAYCSFNTKCELWEDGFELGAEFGYNKAKEEMQKQIEKMNNVEEHTSFDEVEGDYIRLQPDEKSKFELRRIN